MKAPCCYINTDIACLVCYSLWWKGIRLWRYCMW